MTMGKLPGKDCAYIAKSLPFKQVQARGSQQLAWNFGQTLECQDVGNAIRKRCDSPTTTATASQQFDCIASNSGHLA